MQLRKTLPWVLAIAMAFCGLVSASTTGNIKVTVTDQNGEAIPGATVSAEASDSLTKRSDVTNAKGEAFLPALEPSQKWIVTTTLTGFATAKNENVTVASSKTVSLFVKLQASEMSEQMVVTAENSVVDVGSAVVGQDITLDLTESLPTGRTFQAYLQLASSTKPSAGGNPSSKSGVNFTDIDGATGASSDNVYYIDGVNVTDPEKGTHGANFNSEIIQEQHIITGGVPAEYEGGSGLVSQVVTKSGGNEFAGSVNYYFQNDSLVADNKHFHGNTFSDFDSAFTLGGPIIKDRLWFYISYQVKDRDEDVYNNEGVYLRSVKRSEDLSFAKFTYQISADDQLTFQYFSDPFERSGSLDANVVSNRDLARDQGGDNMKLSYTKVFGAAVFTADIGKHEGELTDGAANPATRNTIAYLRSDNPTNEQIQLGGSGSFIETFRNRDFATASLEYMLDSSWARHTLKAGLGWSETTYKEDLQYTGDGAQYTSLANLYSNYTLDQAVAGSIWSNRAIVAADFPRILAGIAASSAADQAYFNNLLDTDHNGSISAAELGSYRFSSTANNPNGAINLYRIVQAVNAPYSVKSRGTSFFLQDKMEAGKWTFNAGIRAEEWKHLASDGSEVFTFDWEMAPRLSVAYDINGDGRQKAFAYFGRYYDPVRNNMTDFAGALTGPVREEQVFLGDRWLTFRTRGGNVVLDSIFAPSTKTPYTDELMLGYAHDLGNNMSIEGIYTKRETGDLLEDYDYNLYLASNGAGDFALDANYYGITDPATLQALVDGDINYIIATLKGGERKYDGIELIFRKRMSNNWQMLASYNNNNAEGNSNSDSNADFQGDWIALDPRAPNMYGDQPGNIEHLLKLSGSYRFNNGLEFGGSYFWNSGILYSTSQLISRRHLPVMVDEAYTVGGATDTWVLPNSIGTNKTDAFGTLDLRAKYVMSFASRFKAEFFIDIFNALDQQEVTEAQDLLSGDGDTSFGEGKKFVEPRRFYLGARVSF